MYRLSQAYPQEYNPLCCNDIFFFFTLNRYLLRTLILFLIICHFSFARNEATVPKITKTTQIVLTRFK